MTDHVSTNVRLDHEWARLNHRAEHVRRAAEWGIAPLPPRTLDDVVLAIGRHARRTPESECRLRRLVVIARTDDLAARVVIERLKPGLLSIGRRYADRPDAFEELLAVAWISIRTFNPERRPSSTAVALLSDAEWGAFRQQQRRHGWREQPQDVFDVLPDDPARDPLVELAELVRHARAAGMHRDDLELVRRLAADHRTDDIARDLNVTARTVRNRRDRVTTKLREIALAA
jgi:DNA-directed RNA polymerase specialized sigma24 family protein